MNRIIVALGLVAALALPATVVAKPKPDQANKRAAIAQCKSERGKSSATREAFRTKYHTGSMSRCVRQNAVEEAVEEQTAHKNASQECRAEREELGQQGFADKYGTNGNKRNAFGKCVSGKAKAEKEAMDEQDAEEVAAFKNAAKECASERETMGDEAFADEYGTNANKRNAFGKCVSKKAREAEAEQPPTQA